MTFDSTQRKRLRKTLRENFCRKHLAYTRHLCEQILQEEPDDYSTLIRYADTMISLGHFKFARDAIDQFEKYTPEEHAHVVPATRARIHSMHGNHAAAEAEYLTAFDGFPNEAGNLIFAGMEAFAQGEIERAESHARRATECPAGCIDEAYFNLGGYLMAQKRYEEARQCYQRAIEIDPDYSEAKWNLKDIELVLAAINE